MLVTRDAERRAGVLERCSETACVLDGQEVARTRILWIGLGTGDVAPPSGAGSETDEAYLADGGTKPGRLDGVDEERVVIGGESLARGRVRWVHLAHARPAGSRPGPDAGPAPEPTAATVCPPGRPLGAWVALRNDLRASIGASPPHPSCRGFETWFLRFRLESDEPAGVYPTRFRARAMRYDIRSDGCADTPGDGAVCTLDPPAHIAISGSIPVEAGRISFDSLQPQLTILLPDPLFVVHWEGECRTSAGSVGHYAEGFQEISIAGSDDPDEIGAHSCSDYLVEPGPCGIEFTQECGLSPELFQVIPFEGHVVDGDRSSRADCNQWGSSELAWAVCCGCAESERPPAFAARR